MYYQSKARRKGFFARFLLLFSVFLLAVATLYTVASLKDARAVYQNVVRLHILADSDDGDEQRLKLKVRDALLDEYGAALSAREGKADTVAYLDSELSKIRALCERTVAGEGASHAVSVSLCNEYYPTRAYDGFDLPAGQYTSLRIEIGSGEGKNWFCMVYPPLCTASAEADEALLEAGFSESQVRLLTENEEGYTLRFKIVETVSDCVERVKAWWNR